MSYYSDVTGEMTFSRSLKKSEMESPELTQAIEDSYFWELTEETTEHVVEIEGETTVVHTTKAVGLAVKEVDEIGAIGYGWDSALQCIVNALPEDVTVSGYFQAEGTENCGRGYEAERLYVSRWRDVVTTKPTVTWPAPPEGAVA
jgi:hypothetical protein